MTVDELKSLFLDYCQKDPASTNKQLIGMEYENFILVPKKHKHHSDLYPLPVHGDVSVNNVLENLVELSKGTSEHFEKIYENNMLLALISPSGSKITIEPGGQFELSDAPRNSFLEVQNSFKEYLNLLKKSVSYFGGKLLFQGVQPLNSLDELPFFPKNRYQIMFPHMLNTGLLGQWMMKASAGIQVSIDYASLEDLERKFVLLNRLSPFLTAIFANSPIIQGKPSGFLSYRSNIWNSTDNKRSGLPESFLSEDFRLVDYISWALKAEPYHLKRDGKFIVTKDLSFQQLIDGKNSDLKMEMIDWEDHLGMLFPDIRIKNILEVRVIDSMSPQYSIAVPALISSLLYNENTFNSVQSILMDFPKEEFSIYKRAAAKDALKAEVNKTYFSKTGRLILEKAIEGLGSEDENWLIPFFEKFTKHGLTPADEALKMFQESGENRKKWLEDVLEKDNY